MGQYENFTVFGAVQNTGFGADSWMLMSVEECSVSPWNRLDPEVTIYASLFFQSVGVLHELSVSHFDI